MSDKQKFMIKKQLDNELAEIRFSKQANVLRRSHPRSFLQKLNHWWNKEITIPLIPVWAVIILLVGINLTDSLYIPNSPNMENLQHRQLVKVAENIYWSDLIEGEMNR